MKPQNMDEYIAAQDETLRPRLEEMHESQKKVDRMDYLIHMQEKRMK